VIGCSVACSNCQQLFVIAEAADKRAAESVHTASSTGEGVSKPDDRPPRPLVSSPLQMYHHYSACTISA